jgi:hypothetical protein
VLAGQRPAVLEHQVRGLVEERAVLAQAARGQQVEVDAAVDAAVAEVTVDRGAVPVAVHERTEAPQVRPQQRRRHRRVVPSLPVLTLAGDEGGGPAPALADAPELDHLGRAVEQPHRHGRVAAGQSFHALAGVGVALLDRLSAELGHQPPLALGQKRQRRGVHVQPAHVIDQDLVQPLERQRPAVQDLRHVVGGGEDVGVAAHQHRAGRRAVHEPDRRLHHGHERPLAAHQRPRHVEAVLGQQLVEVVARHATRDVGIRLPDPTGMAVAQ